MTSIEAYVLRIRPAVDDFVKQPSKTTLAKVKQEVTGFDFSQAHIFQAQIVVPLVIKLDELKGESQELRTSLLDVVRHIVSQLYLADERGLRSILMAALLQLRDPGGAKMLPNLSEEIKLAAVLCMSEALRRSPGDVLEMFYTKDKMLVIGQVLLTLVALIQQEKYRKLVIASLDCLMVLFGVQEGVLEADYVLRHQIANTIFIYLPKVVTVLFVTAKGDDKMGQTIKSMAVKALGRIICIMFEETDKIGGGRYGLDAFRLLFDNASKEQSSDLNLFASKRSTQEENDERLRQLQANPRSADWMTASMKHMTPIFAETSILRAHDSIEVRKAYAEMCCLLLQNCGSNLQKNFLHLLESTLALSEDEDQQIAQLCQTTLRQLQDQQRYSSIFDENAELLLDTHLHRLPRILHRCDDNEQFAELLFLKGCLHNLSADKLQLLMLVPKNLALFVMCLLSALDQSLSRQLLNEEYSLRKVVEGSTRELASQLTQLPWRQFKYLSSKRCVDALYDIGALLGSEPALYHLIFDFCQDLIIQHSPSMNEAILLITLMITPQQRTERSSRLKLAQLFVDQLLADEHWQLALQPDAAWRLKPDKPTSWWQDHTPGMYSAALEVRTQDCDSDDESEPLSSRVSISDAQFNVLHTCIVLDALGHCASFIGDTFDRHIFRSLHRVLLKLASSNTIVHQAATFAFVSIQRALKYAQPSHFIECSTDYITFHLNTLLKKSPESNAAVDILSVVLQYSTRGNVPHLDSIFQTICEECANSHQSDNIYSYLRVFNAFLRHVTSWQSETVQQVDDIQMQVEDEEHHILNTWLNVLNKVTIDEPIDLNSAPKEEPDVTMPPEGDEEDPSTTEPSKPELPRHIAMTKEILSQVIKFLSNAEQTQQILALECLATGVPLLADYENEFLPLVHLIWQPLVEKFRQKDALVLSRCFSLLHILGLHAKDFILKRSLSDVVPQLREFLKAASVHSIAEKSLAPTQEYKLQLKLLQHLPAFIRSLQIDGKHLHDLLSIVALYLSQAQPKEMQQLAAEVFHKLFDYNGPFVYVTLLQRAHLKDYKTNVNDIFDVIGLSLAKQVDVDLN
ncbi:uncharacterized protein LOC132787610 [Drosophila nasuta]|uniref:uncharacterized protein LOC132787610 n=1 Tax=Drosophila nasuta TaxID=42062 RepID=UPI00295E756C|nr:uncharacterized protein LOC132787610 [Drosophila nasuta]